MGNIAKGFADLRFASNDLYLPTSKFLLSVSIYTIEVTIAFSLFLLPTTLRGSKIIVCIFNYKRLSFMKFKNFNNVVFALLTLLAVKS